MPQLGQEVVEHIASMDDARIHEVSLLKYFRNFWDTYKGHVRGLLAGVVLGALLGTGIGLAVCCVPGILGAVGAIPLIAAFAGTGAMIEGTAFGSAGAGAASRASGLAEKHARQLDPGNNGDPLSAANDLLMQDGRGHHFEYPPERDKSKFFIWKSGLLGTAVGVVAGALLAVAGGLAGIPLFLSLGGTVGAGALICGLFGLTFGIDRSVFKSIFNQADANLQGELHDGRQGPDLGREQSKGRESGAELLQRRTRRQDEITYLEKNYNDKIFMSSIRGLFRGLVGGIMAGGLIGLGVGALAFGVAALTGTTMAFMVLPCLFAGAGALLGMNVFAETGANAAAEATARAIDDEFIRNQALRARGITPPAPAPAPQGRGFSPRIALLMGAIGAAAGVFLTPVIGVPALLGIQPALAASTAFPFLSTATSAVISGTFGASFGISSAAWRYISRFTDYLYEKSYFHADSSPLQIIPAKPLSPLPTVPAYGKVTAEEAASLAEKQNAGNGKNHGQMLNQQLLNSRSSNLTIGA